MKAHLWPSHDGDAWAARLEADSWSGDLFFERIGEPLPAMGRADALLIASLHAFMTRNVEVVHVHGAVSRTLLRNLDELQHVWSKWLPRVYRRVTIEVEEVVDDGPTGEGAVSAFSGGIDASFTVYRHTVAPAAWHTLPLREVVMIQGYDIGLDETPVFERAVARAEKMTAEAGLQLSKVRTNIRGIAPRWNDTFGLGVAAALQLFADRRSTGLIASGGGYAALVFPNGSSPLHDWMTSSGSMAIRHDGAGYTRTQKLAELSAWPAAVNAVRVCYRGAEHDRNCGHCEKCVRTLLNFKLVGIDNPGCFDNTLDLADIRKVYFANAPMAGEWQALVIEAERRGIAGEWVDEVKRLIRKEKYKATALGRVVSRANRLRR